MKIRIIFKDSEIEVNKYFQEFKLGINCKNKISICYDSANQILKTSVESDEFTDEAIQLCKPINIHFFESEIDMVLELKAKLAEEYTENQLRDFLREVGNFTSEIAFTVISSNVEKEKFYYKYTKLSEVFDAGIVLYRNAFSVASYEGSKDWLELDKRARLSPAAATHTSGSWRVRRNQLAGKVEIDKKTNEVLRDMSNRQGLEEDIYYELFIMVVIKALEEFENYRQTIIRRINVKNEEEREVYTPVVNRIISDPKTILKLTEDEAGQLVSEIKEFKSEEKKLRTDKKDVEGRYIYDIRILNVLATNGLKAASIAHETENDRNQLLHNYSQVVNSLKAYKMWDILNSEENTAKAYRNVPHLLIKNKEISEKVLVFMNTMLSKIEKKQFDKKEQNISNVMSKIQDEWQKDFRRVKIEIDKTNFVFNISEDVLYVIFDNLILNSIQQNESLSPLEIKIMVKKEKGILLFSYLDNGKGLNKKYLSNPEKILEVHETTRKDGHGLGMWIVNNTIINSGGKIIELNGSNGFYLKFRLGESI